MREPWEGLLVTWPVLRGEQECTPEALWRLQGAWVGAGAARHRPGSG